jgi:hypothetical protein
MASTRGLRPTAIVHPGDFKGLQRVLDTMKPAAQTRFMRRAIREAFRNPHRMMRRLAPKKTGKLRRSIRTTIQYSRSRRGYIARLGPGFRGPENKRARHAHLIELGTRGGKYQTSGTFTYPSGTGLVRTDEIIRQPGKAVGFVARTRAAHQEKLPARIREKLNEAVLAAWRGSPKT